MKQILLWLAIAAAASDAVEEDVEPSSDFTLDQDDWVEEADSDDEGKFFVQAGEGEPFHKRMAEIISLVDTNKDGFLSVDEVENWTRKAENYRREREAAKELRRIDKDNDGSVDWNEWRTVGLQYQSGLVPKDVDEQEKLLRLRFNSADEDLDGRVSPKEAKTLLLEGDNNDEQLLLFASGMVKEHDQNNDGKVTFEEFLDTAHPETLTGLPEELADGEPDENSERFNKKQMAYMREDFAQADADNDGSLSVAEIAAVLRDEAEGWNRNEAREEQLQHFVGDVMVVMAEATGILDPLPENDEDSNEELHAQQARKLSIPVEASKKVWTLLANSPLTVDGAMLRDPSSFDFLQSVSDIAQNFADDDDNAALHDEL